MAIYYIGAFPPVYGGVTIKNKYLYEALSSQLPLKKIDMNLVKKGSIREILRLSWAILTGKQYIIGLAGQKNRRVITKLLYAFKRSAMKRSILLVMGGIVEDILSQGPDFLKKMDTYRRVYLEFPSMAETLTSAGMTNAAVYPNGRPRPEKNLPVTVSAQPLQCVFFSLIQREKGVDRILEAAKQLPQVSFHFYGSIVPDYREAFLNTVTDLENAAYHGIFTGDSDAVYEELNKYDVLLLPTRCKTEGLPGILIEAKIAGLAAIVTDLGHNREVVADGCDGIVLAEDTAQCLTEAIHALHRSREDLLNRKLAARDRAEEYYIDVCAAGVRDALTQI